MGIQPTSLASLLDGDLLLVAAVNIFLWAWVQWVPSRVVQVSRLFRGARGLALPGLILVAGEPNPTLLDHERVHILQMRKWSPLGVACILAWHYLIGTLIVRLRTGSWPGLWERWQACPLEVQAQQPEQQAEAAIRVNTRGLRERNQGRS